MRVADCSDAAIAVLATSSDANASLSGKQFYELELALVSYAASIGTGFADILSGFWS